MNFAIQTENLTKVFANKIVVDSLNLEVSEGTIFGFLGPNGAGKTTTMKLLLGLLKPSGGECRVKGFHSWTQGNIARQYCGVLFEEPGLYDWISGLDNAKIFGKLYDISFDTIKKQILQITERFSFGEHEMISPIRKLSYGNRKKWSLCIALALNPKIIFLDEPTANLDPSSAHEFRKQIMTLSRESGTTVFLNTHNLDEALRLCGQIGIIREGKLKLSDKTEKIIEMQKSFKISYQGEKIERDILKNLPGEIIECGEAGLVVTVKQRQDIALYVRFLVEKGRGILEVVPASNPLEEILLEL
jgi:ABC-2 type transport system ATP-binding protein